MCRPQKKILLSILLTLLLQYRQPARPSTEQDFHFETRMYAVFGSCSPRGRVTGKTRLWVRTQ